MTSIKRSRAALGETAKIDTWAWGNEILLAGSEPGLKYTWKVLVPKVGRAGCLSLQSHSEKEETWLCQNGLAWALLILEGQVCTRLLYPGEIQHLESGIMHRLAAVAPDTWVAEVSTPDRHAADKSAPKDVIRWHDVHGRDVTPPQDPEQARLISECAKITEEALTYIDRGQAPREYNTELFLKHGARIIP